jgi:hypothetical protein
VSAECIRLARAYDAWWHGEPQPEDGDLPLSARDAAAEAARIISDNGDLRSLGGKKT